MAALGQYCFELTQVLDAENVGAVVFMDTVLEGGGKSEVRISSGRKGKYMSL